MKHIHGTAFIHGFATQCRIGCEETERQAEQPVLIDVDCVVDMTRAIASDAREDCVDYCKLQSIVKNRVTDGHHLLEGLAHAIAQKTLLIAEVVSVEVTIRKPYKLSGVTDVGVTLKLHREEV